MLSAYWSHGVAVTTFSTNVLCLLQGGCSDCTCAVLSSFTTNPGQQGDVGPDNSDICI